MFVDSDSFIQYIEDIVRNIQDDYVTSRYVGFIATTAVTVYEVAIKKLLIEFARSQHPMLGNFISSELEKFNARINTKQIKESYLNRFGAEYSDSFKSLLNAKESELIKGGSITQSYANIIGWRNRFLHTGRVPENPTFDETVKAYKLGKEVVYVLSKVLES